MVHIFDCGIFHFILKLHRTSEARKLVYGQGSLNPLRPPTWVYSKDLVLPPKAQATLNLTKLEKKMDPGGSLIRDL